MAPGADPDPDQKLARRGRLASVVIALAFSFWLGAQYLGGRLGWDVRLALVVDGLAILAMLWGLWTAFQIWRARRL